MLKNKSLMINYYEILNVEPTTSLDEIRKKFKIKALAMHPDKNKNLDANHKMQELNQALATLNNKKLKYEYDKQLFIYALKNGDHKVVNFFINNPTKLPFTLSSDEINNNMLLHYACLLGSLSVVQLLIKVGVNIDQFDIKGNTALRTMLVCQDHYQLCSY